MRGYGKLGYSRDYPPKYRPGQAVQMTIHVSGLDVPRRGVVTAILPQGSGRAGRGSLEPHYDVAWDRLAARDEVRILAAMRKHRPGEPHYEVHPNLLGPVAEQRVPEGYLRAGRRTPASRTAKANPASERAHSVPELLMAVQDLVLWARGIGPATSRTRYYLRAAGYPKGGDRAFWLGEALDEVKRDAQHDPRVASHVAYMLKEYPGARVNPARVAKANPAKARSARSARGGKRKPFQVQSYEFDKSSFTEARAKAWLKQHGYRSAIDEGPEFYHARQHSPSDYQKGTLHTIAIAKHVQAIVGIPKRGSDASEASGYGARGPRQGRLFGAKGAKGARGARGAAPVYDDEVPF